MVTAKSKKESYGKLNTCALAMAMGILWGVSLLLVGLISICCDYGSGFVSALGSIYIGYASTALGSFLGLVWGFIDGFVGGFLLAYLYNLCLGCAKCCCCFCKCKK